MGVTVDDDRLEQLTHLAGAVLEVAQQLAASTTTVREAEPVLEPGDPAAALIADLLADETMDGALVARRAAAAGCDLSLGALALCVELQCPKADYVVALITDGCDQALVRVGAEGGRVYALLPATGTCIAGSVGAVRILTRRLAPYGLVGISSYQAHAGDLGRALREAELVLEVIRNCDERVASEVGSGTYRLLLRMIASHPEDVREFHAATVGPLARYDELNGTQLVLTLDAYLERDCNMNTTAAAVYAHRHTVAARLERIRALTGLDPLHHEARERLGLGLKIHRLLSA